MDKAKLQVESVGFNANRQRFQDALLDWYDEQGRAFPWRETTDPFLIIVAEICLQKTGASKAVSAYDWLPRNCDTPEKLASARVEELRLLFQPLGLPSRAELLIVIANDIARRFSGRVPTTYEELTSIKGIGTYIANATLVFGHSIPLVLVDEGIARVYRRTFGFSSERRAYADKELWRFAADIIPISSVREYYWALLDLSAQVCVLRNPLCDACPLARVCKHAAQRSSSQGRSEQ